MSYGVVRVILGGFCQFFNEGGDLRVGPSRGETAWRKTAFFIFCNVNGHSNIVSFFVFTPFPSIHIIILFNS